MHRQQRPLPEPIAQAVRDGNLVAAAVLSGNRNFEGRINPDVRANYLASPPLVVAYALAGTTDIDLTHEPLGKGKDGHEVYLKDLWPSSKEIEDTLAKAMNPEMFREQYSHATQGPKEWQEITGAGGQLYHWNEASTYVHEPPFFQDMPASPGTISGIHGARCLLSLGDSVTTDTSVRPGRSKPLRRRGCICSPEASSLSTSTATAHDAGMIA